MVTPWGQLRLKETAFTWGTVSRRSRASSRGRPSMLLPLRPLSSPRAAPARAAALGVGGPAGREGGAFPGGGVRRPPGGGARGRAELAFALGAAQPQGGRR